MKTQYALALLLLLTSATATLSVAPWYPKGYDYVFNCQDSGAQTYNWYFGDGTQLPNIKSSSVFHTFPRGGDFIVKCEAKGTNAVNTYTLPITVTDEPTGGGPTQEIVAEVSVAQWYPKITGTGNTYRAEYVFNCDTTDWNPTSYTWDFGDGTGYNRISNQNVFHVFKQPGQYIITCKAHTTQGTLEDRMQINPA
jgi:hypothetical protein